MSVIEAAGDLYVTRAGAAAVLAEAGACVSPNAVRSWAQRGLIEPVAVLDGRCYYDMRDVWHVEAATRTSRWAKRSAPTA